MENGDVKPAKEKEENVTEKDEDEEDDSEEEEEELGFCLIKLSRKASEGKNTNFNFCK